MHEDRTEYNPVSFMEQCPRDSYEDAIAYLSEQLQYIEFEKYNGIVEMANNYTQDSPPGSKIIAISSNERYEERIIDQRLGTLARLISYTIAALEYAHYKPEQEYNNQTARLVTNSGSYLNILIKQANKICSINNDNRDDIAVLQNFLIEGQHDLAKKAGISPKALLEVDDISTFIRPIVQNTHKSGDTTIFQRFEPITYMSEEQKAVWRNIANDTAYPGWWSSLSPHYQSRYKQYAKDAIVFEDLTTRAKEGIMDAIRDNNDIPTQLSKLSPERQSKISREIGVAENDGQLEAYLEQLLYGDPWFLLAMPKSSGNRHTPLASNHVRIITTTKYSNQQPTTNITHVRSNEVIIKSARFTNLPFDYGLLDASSRLQHNDWVSKILNGLLLFLLLPLRIVASLCSDIVMVWKYPRKTTTFLLWNFMTTSTHDKTMQRQELIGAAEDTLKQVYDDFYEDSSKEKYNAAYSQFLEHHGLETDKRMVGGDFTFSPILHSASLLSPLPDWIENSVDIGCKFFGSDANKKMLLYKLAAVERINSGNKLVVGAKIRAINFAANDYRHLAISGYGNRIYRHNNHESTELLRDVLRNTIVVLAHAGVDCQQAIDLYSTLSNACQVNDTLYDLSNLSEPTITTLKEQIYALHNSLNAEQHIPEKAKTNLSLTLQAASAYIELYPHSSTNIPENEQILLASYANMMVNGSSGPASRVETHCKSGRDRTFVVQLYEQAMQAYFSETGMVLKTEADHQSRQRFVQIYVELFMQGLAQENSNQNRHGSFGLNNLLNQRPWPLCLLAGTTKPQNTALLPADILEAILDANPEIAAENQGQRHNGKHIKTKALSITLKKKTGYAMAGFSKSVCEIALSPLFLMSLLSNEYFPSINPLWGGIIGTVILVAILASTLALVPISLPLIIGASLITLNTLYYATNPQLTERYGTLAPIIAIAIPLVIAPIIIFTAPASITVVVLASVLSVVIPGLATVLQKPTYIQQKTAPPLTDAKTIKESIDTRYNHHARWLSQSSAHSNGLASSEPPSAQSLGRHDLNNNSQLRSEP